MTKSDGQIDRRRRLRGDPLPWLLEADTPAVRHLALRELLGRSSTLRACRVLRAAAADEGDRTWAS